MELSIISADGQDLEDGAETASNGGQHSGHKSDFTYISCTFGMMPAAFGSALPATSRSKLVVVRAAKTGPDFAREVPESTRYVGEKCGRSPPEICPH